MISTRVHGALDYAGGAMLLAARGRLTSSDPRGRAVLRAAGAGMLVGGAVTDHELAIRRLLPMPLHLAGDAALGALLISAPFTLRRKGRITAWVPHVILGAGAVAAAALTDRTPSDKAARASQSGHEDPLPGAPHATGTTGPAARTAPGETGVQVAAPPPEMPGPSVTPPMTPESDTERAEWAEGVRPDADAPAQRRLEDELVAQEEAAAAAEAAAIGGRVTHDAEDPAMDPVYQAGGGEQDGWEAAETDLIENATHGDGHGNPLRDALTGELESDRSGAVYGEADHVPATEVVEDPESSGDDPGAGPGIAADR